MGDTMQEKDNSSVQVAVRIRPLIESEISRGCGDILEVFPAIQQIRVKNTEKAFTYNYVCDSKTTQETFYNMCVKHMLENLFQGYNMTILAYGQTGSGKTHSMGTTYTGDGEMGIIPRAINDIFNYVNDNFAYDFNITVSFMELYQEILYDLLAQKPREQCIVEIREDLNKGMIIPGLTEETVTSASKTLEYLSRGSGGRATGSTNMNAQSSRSHAIFTINICMQRKDNSNLNKMAKFHLVDLAGSERSKKTGATGVTFKEGVNINKGLLALGNVISALGDEKQNGYIGYRDSNLTRLLKDSLGGNSITLMIACVSPADYNVEESISTMRYADRAKKIKNKPVINQDPKAAEINRLNKLVQQLRLELVGQGGPIICQAELELLKNENISLRGKNRELTLQLSSTLNENTGLFERVMLMQTSNERMHKKLCELKEEYNVTVNNINMSMEQNDTEAFKGHMSKLHTMQNMFCDIDTERQKAELEIRKHERCGSASNASNPELSAESELSERQESHTKHQMALNTQLQEVTKMLAMKEDLAQQMQTNNCNMIDYTAITENEERISALEKEKAELLQQLKTANSTGVSNKIAEQRRKRVQELEKEIHDLHRKLTEQARLIKLKERDENKIKLLNSEISQMKSTKVRLIKNMKGESEKFRVWKLQRERELIKLKDQDRKRQNQIVRMENMHNRQQNVLKRKVEEAVAVNKRLKDALALRKVVHDQKNSGRIERLTPWVQQELNIFVNTVDAEATLAVLLDDRASYAKQLSELRANPKTDPADIKQIEDEIEMQSTQIQDLQQKLLDSDEENKAKSRWDNVQTMGEAKYCLKVLFELTAEIRRKEATNEAKIQELQNMQAETSEKIARQESNLKFMQGSHQHELSNLAKHYEEKISVLLRQLRGVPMEGIEQQDLQERCTIQQQMLEQVEYDLEKLRTETSKTEEALRLENMELKKTLEEIKFENTTVKTPEPVVETKRPAKKRVHTAGNVIPSITYLEPVELDTSYEDDPNGDPDWRKTPLAKRIRAMRKTSVLAYGDRLAVNSSSGGCGCNGNCSKRNCRCKKVSNACNDMCGCKSDLCSNRTVDKENDTEEEIQKSSDDEDQDSFKRPRPLHEDQHNVTYRANPQRSRKTRQLFVMTE